MKNNKIGFIGTGNMANAIINGIVSKQLFPCSDIGVYDVDNEKCAVLREKLSVTAAESIADIIENYAVVFLSVKPQVYPVVLEDIKKCGDCDNIFVSIAAGISTDYVKSALGFEGKVIRVMPNTPLLLGCGATAMSYKAPVSDFEFEFVKKIFESSGIVSVLDESKMNEVIAVNGSSPAYIYLFAKAMIDGAQEQGIDPDTAKSLVAQTLIGSARMLTESGDDPQTLIDKVSSPGGTTLKALEALYEMNFEAAVKEAMARCTKRAYELGK